MKMNRILQKAGRLAAAFFLAAAIVLPLLPQAAYAGNGVAVNAENFPDENFRTYVLNNIAGNDGSLSAAEIAAVESMDVSGSGIADLKGIEYFTSLTELDCSGNSLTSLDVSPCTALQKLDCMDNQLTSLVLGSKPDLYILQCAYNQLSCLDLSQCPALTGMTCSDNPLTDLDVSQCAALEGLEFWETAITRLDVSRNTALTFLSCPGNQLESLVLSPSLTHLECYQNQLTSLDVSRCTALEYLRCDNNQLTSLDLAGTSLHEVLNGKNYFHSQSGTVHAACRSGKAVVDLANDLGLDMVKVSNVSVTEGTYTDGVAYFDLPVPSAARITYDYDTENPAHENNRYMDVTLKVHPLAHHDRIDPTCTEQGQAEYWTCSVCGASFHDEKATEEIADLSTLALPALGHAFSADWTMDETGHWHVCSRCGEKKDVTAHAYGPWIHTGSHTHECTVCGYQETEECTFGEWTVTRQPTAAEKGQRQRTCSKCGYIETEEISATGTASPDTGDHSHAALWAIFLLMAAGAGILILHQRKGREWN